MAYLRVYKGPATRPVENTTFREIASRLKLLFRTEKFNGVLLGNPVCKNDLSLSVDILIITKYSILILELKNYGNGVLHLPQPQYFFDGYWYMEDGATGERSEIKGGASHSPFFQLHLQRNRLRRQLEGLGLENFDSSRISTGVIFQQPIEFCGYVPDRFANSFFICDINDYLDEIYDFINIDDERNFLSDDEIDKIIKLFKAKPYSNTLVCAHRHLRRLTIRERIGVFLRNLRERT